MLNFYDTYLFQLLKFIPTNETFFDNIFFGDIFDVIVPIVDISSSFVIYDRLKFFNSFPVSQGFQSFYFEGVLYYWVCWRRKGYVVSPSFYTTRLSSNFKLSEIQLCWVLPLLVHLGPQNLYVLPVTLPKVLPKFRGRGIIHNIFYYTLIICSILSVGLSFQPFHFYAFIFMHSFNLCNVLIICFLSEIFDIREQTW